MTTEEIKNNVEFRTIRKLIKTKYPFVKDLVPTDNQEEYKSILFTDVIIDMNKFMEMHDLKLTKWEKQFWEFLGDKNNLRSVRSLYISSFKNVLEGFESDLRKMMFKIHRSNVVPKEYKLDRTPDISAIKTYDDIEDRFIEM